jgi:hypothetical protein
MPARNNAPLHLSLPSLNSSPKILRKCFKLLPSSPDALRNKLVSTAVLCSSTWNLMFIHCLVFIKHDDGKLKRVLKIFNLSTLLPRNGAWFWRAVAGGFRNWYIFILVIRSRSRSALAISLFNCHAFYVYLNYFQKFLLLNYNANSRPNFTVECVTLLFRIPETLFHISAIPKKDFRGPTLSANSQILGHYVTLFNGHFLPHSTRFIIH